MVKLHFFKVNKILKSFFHDFNVPLKLIQLDNMCFGIFDIFSIFGMPKRAENDDVFSFCSLFNISFKEHIY